MSPTNVFTFNRDSKTEQDDGYQGYNMAADLTNIDVATFDISKARFVGVKGASGISPCSKVGQLKDKDFSLDMFEGNVVGHISHPSCGGTSSKIEEDTMCQSQIHPGEESQQEYTTQQLPVSKSGNGFHGSLKTMPVSSRSCQHSFTRNLAIFFVLSLTSLTVCNAQVYPPLFNAAKEKRVTVEPADNICGISAVEEFCKSSSDPQTLTSCWEGECDLSCPKPLSNTAQLPYVELAFDRIIGTWGTCVYQDFENLAPASPSANVQKFKVRFSANGTDACHLDLQPDWMVNIFLQSIRSITLSAWMRPMQTTSESTIFEIGNAASSSILRLGLSSSRQIFITSKNQPLTSRSSWIIPADHWTHVSVLIYNETVAVFLNGSYASPAAYQVKFPPTRMSAKYRIGKSFLSNDYFKGDMQDFRIYTDSVSNREVMEIFAGQLPDTRVLSNCRCPSAFPRLKEKDRTYCVANDGYDMSTQEAYRIQRMSYPLEFINDGKRDSAWIGRIGVERTTITIDLGTQYEVLNVKILFYTPFPETMIIERRQNTTEDWTVWQYYAHDCPTKFRLPVNSPLSTERSVSCRPMITTDEAPASNGEVVFDLLAGRPGANGSTYTYSLRQFLQASSIKLILQGYPFSSLSGKQYHGINEVSVNSRCNCYGHGTACDISGKDYTCTCDPSTYTKGRQCDECASGTYRDSTKDIYSPLACKPCDCHTSGTQGGDTTCQHIGGQCNCKPFVGRRRCDTCMPGYHSLDPGHPDGCQECDCDTTGTIEGSNICDVTDAQCPCKPQFTGLRCDQCKSGYYRKDNHGDTMECISCDCHSAGSVSGDGSCEQSTGQCLCKPAVTGKKCDQCKDGYYSLASTNPDGCTECSCDPDGSESTKCNNVTGQCQCKPNVVGRKCDQCLAGFYALDEQDFVENGCSLRCGCSVNGTDPKGIGRCEKFGGQCLCKSNTDGKRCDTCQGDTYGFNQDAVSGCVPCDCDPRGGKDTWTSCDLDSGQCWCKENVNGRKCDTCKEGTYWLNADRPEGCLSCSCYEPGTIPGNVCDQDTGRCLCIEGAGDPAVTDFKCEPYITSIVPNYGPESGGTMIEIRGGFLGNINETEVRVGSQLCDLVTDIGNHTSIVCITRSLRQSQVEEEVKGRELPLSLKVAGITATSPDMFKYLEDPSITDISPRQTFLEGGIVLTVSGTHLNSVYRPIMEVTMMSTMKGDVIFTAVCYVKKPGSMHCPTPTIEIPKELGVEGARRKRSAMDSENNINGSPEIGASKLKEHHRQKRSNDDPKPINRDSLQFYLGFILDGVTIYRNLNDTLPEFAVLRVFLNPVIERFEEEDDTELVRMFRPYWPYNHKFLRIKGERLSYAATASDYTVDIGSVKCKDLQLTTNQITCTPPAMQPDLDPAHPSGNGEPAVVVTVGNIRVHTGWMDYEHNFWENPTFRYGVIGGLAAFLLLLILICACCCCCCRKKKGEDQTDKHPNLELSGKGLNNAYISAYNGSQTSYMNPTMELLMLLPEELQEKVQGCLIDYKRMELGKLIGQGHFGRVYVGRLSVGNEQMPIAIKTLREYHVTPRDVTYFLDEATIMKDLEHEHVLNLVGVIIENNKAYVILPYMENGDLKSFISNEDNLLTVGELINFGQQVAEGMCYLSNQKFVHRDLAARNCMVDKNMVVKIADFGLSREIYQSDYYKESDAVRPLPVKWMSFESLDKGLYTVKSDVWSFGVLLWELMTRGCTPYPDVDAFDMKLYLAHGNRMDKPDFAPNELYELMLRCWQADPNLRPNFYELNDHLLEILEGQNSTTTMRKRQELQVRPESYSQVAANGYAEVSREF